MAMNFNETLFDTLDHGGGSEIEMLLSGLSFIAKRRCKLS